MFSRNVYFFKLIFFALLIILFNFSISFSQLNHEILAKIDNEIITSHDLDEKVGFFRYILQIDNNFQLNPIFKKYALIKLIEDKLMYREINLIDPNLLKRSNEVSEKLIIQRSGISKTALIKELNEFGFSFDSFVKFYSIKIAFNSIINSKYKQRFDKISKNKSKRHAFINKNLDKEFISFSEIVLKPNIFFDDKENEVLSNLIYDLTQEYISFSNLSELFSSSNSKLNKGKKLWILLNELNKDFRNNIDQLKFGEISKPFKIGENYYIIQNNGKINYGEKDANEYLYSIGRLYVNLVETYSDNEIKRIKDLINNHLKKTYDCNSLSQIIKILKTNNDYQEVKIPFIKIPKDIQKHIMKLKINESSPILKSENGFIVLMVCDKKFIETEIPSEKDLINFQQNELLNKISNQYLNSLVRKSKILIN